MNLKTHIRESHKGAAIQGGLAGKERKVHKENKFRSLCSLRSLVARKGNESAVALVITLLMLSVITFLAIAFLAMTARDKSAVNASLDVDVARSMSDAALARAQAQIMAQMMASNDVLSYDYLTSHNFINSSAFVSGNTYFTNVNYDSFFTNASSYTAADQALNCANLFYDPRPPVFVLTNASLGSNDFRFWVDINRNGKFETNGPPTAPVNSINTLGQWDGTTSVVNGEPEWIGVLKYPETNHSPNNPFIGRYAFMVLPIGKTLDWNYIHNNSRYASGGNANMQLDGFSRDEGVGPWELNLAALLYDISPEFQTNQVYNGYTYNYGAAPYNYNPPAAGYAASGVMGEVNYDAMQFLAFRYGTNGNFPQTLKELYGPTDLAPLGYTAAYNVIDELGEYPSIQPPFDYNQENDPTPSTRPNAPWPGAYNSNMFYDVQDLFDPAKSDSDFVNNLSFAVSQVDTSNRYTFQRLLGCIGTSSSPEYGVYVYSNFTMTGASYSPPEGVPAPSVLRTKVNINYDNTAQIQAGPYNSYGGYTPMPTNHVQWTQLGFFTNAAESLLRSQVFVYTNYVTNSTGTAYVPSNFLYTTFGVTNIPVYSAADPGIAYNPQVHRMLQLAANIYAAAYPVYKKYVPQPPVFRPQFQLLNGGKSNAVLNIIGYTNVTGPNAYTQIINGNWKDVTNKVIGLNDNVWGIPWIIGAVKGIPAFDQFAYNNQVLFDRKLLFVRQSAGGGLAITNLPPYYTNQFYEMQISNVCGMDAWNPYAAPFTGSSGAVVAMASNIMAVTVNNNYNWSNTYYVTNVQIATNLLQQTGQWTGWFNEQGMKTSQGQFRNLMLFTNNVLPLGYFSEYRKQFVIYTNANNYTFLPQDTNQTAFPTHYWTVSVTNHLYYALFDGQANSGNVLDFVNLGPFGSLFPITQYLINKGSNEFIVTPATDAASSPVSQGVLNEINDSFTGANSTYINSLKINGQPDYPGTTGSFGPENPGQGTSVNGAYGPAVCKYDTNGWMACDPLVHYTVGDLIYPVYGNQFLDGSLSVPTPLGIGAVTKRYVPWGIQGNSYSGNMLFMDPQITNSDAWQFPTNLFPSVGWLGRVHRGTPWQTVYLKSDNPSSTPNPTTAWLGWVNSPLTYPTNDWSLVDLFTAVPNDNAARGLLSVNQTNDAAWAAVFAGVIAMTSPTTGTVINPTNDVSYLMDSNFVNSAGMTVLGINAVRTNTAMVTNGLFHHVGEILQSSALTVGSPYLPASGLTDEMVERIPQQTLSLLKVGLPQFVIYSWGQSLKPLSLYSGGALSGICTNYQITGEFLTRTVCHVVSDPAAAAPKIVVDSYNIEPGN